MSMSMASKSPEERVDGLIQLLQEQGNEDYLGEAISQLEHSLQAASLAANSNADNDTVVAALLHDIGQFVQEAVGAETLLYAGQNVGRKGHDAIGAEYLRSLGFKEKVCQLVGAHVVAKRYLCAVFPSYQAGLSPASQMSLVRQGGPFTDEEVKRFESDPLWKEKVQLRKWDDQAKVVGLTTTGLNSYRHLMLNSIVA